MVPQAGVSALQPLFPLQQEAAIPGSVQGMPCSWRCRAWGNAQISSGEAHRVPWLQEQGQAQRAQALRVPD